MPILTELQLRTAHALAQAHGHLWAEALTADEAAGLASLDAIHDAAVAFAVPGLPCGITYPGVQGGVIKHTTASGRLDWAVYPDGGVVIRVNRPGMPGVITARVTPILDLRVQVAEGANVAWRHVDALAVAIAALRPRGGTAEVWSEKIASYLPEALEIEADPVVVTV